MVSEQTRQEDEELREKLRHVDLEKLKRVIKPLIERPQAINAAGAKKPKARSR